MAQNYAATEYNIDVIRGDDWRHVIECVDLSDSPMDWSLWNTSTARIHVRDRRDNLIISFDSDDIEFTTGYITLTKASADTTSLTTNAYMYDLEVEDPLGDTVTILRGNFTINKDVTYD